jgi:hypothetical protein
MNLRNGLRSIRLLTLKFRVIDDWNRPVFKDTQSNITCGRLHCR